MRQPTPVSPIPDSFFFIFINFFILDEITELTKPKVYNYQCEECKKNFSRLSHFKFHKKSHSKENGLVKRHRPLKCCLCEPICLNKTSLYQHFDENHDIKISIKMLKFSDRNEFNYWKESLEKQNQSSLYVNKSAWFLQNIK